MNTRRGTGQTTTRYRDQLTTALEAIVESRQIENGDSDTLLVSSEACLRQPRRRARRDKLNFPGSIYIPKPPPWDPYHRTVAVVVFLQCLLLFRTCLRFYPSSPM